MGKQLRYIAIFVFCWSWFAAPTPPANAFEEIQSHLQERLTPNRRLATMQVAGERLRASRMVKQFYE